MLCVLVALFILPFTPYSKRNIRRLASNVRINNCLLLYTEVQDSDEEILLPPEYNENEINPALENNTTDNLIKNNEIRSRKNYDNNFHNISSVAYTYECSNELNK
ncbi:hypothetical protein DMUE_4022 [Dictyocoela muelleri]|nr:hypothetical protein DMUE_4022 [Dictyocoela muelleri]